MAITNNTLVRIELVLLGTQFHLNDIDLARHHRSQLFQVVNVSTVHALPDMDMFDWSYSKNLLSELFEHNPQADLTIGIIESRIEDNYFMRRIDDKRGVLSLYQASDILANSNVPLINFILVSILRGVTLFHIGNGKVASNAHEMSHDETRNCIFDMVGNKEDIAGLSANPCLCTQCEAKIKEKKMPINYIAVLKSELKHIRKRGYTRIVEFIRAHPFLSIAITAFSSIAINMISSWLYELITR